MNTSASHKHTGEVGEMKARHSGIPKPSTLLEEPVSVDQVCWTVRNEGNGQVVLKFVWASYDVTCKPRARSIWSVRSQSVICTNDQCGVRTLYSSITSMSM